MPTHITQIDQDGTIILRVEGDMRADDARLLERLAVEFISDRRTKVELDLSDLDLLDSDSAAVLRKAQDDHGISIVGMEIFLQSAIDSAERAK